MAANHNTYTLKRDGETVTDILNNLSEVAVFAILQDCPLYPIGTGERFVAINNRTHKVDYQGSFNSYAQWRFEVLKKPEVAPW